MPAWGLRAAGGATAVSRIVSKKASPVGTTGARLDVVWEVDSGSSLNPGDSVSVVVETGPKCAPQEWKLVFYPRGFVDPAVTSFFVTNVGLAAGKPLPADREISAALSVDVLPAEIPGKQSAAKKPGDCSPPEVCRKLFKTFCTKSTTFGFESFADRDRLCSRSSSFLRGSEGTLHLRIGVNVSVGAPLNPPEVDDEVRDSGWQRVKWVIQDFKGLIQNTPSKLSSPSFRVNGEWYFDLYPSGYCADQAKEPGFVSLYLHSTKRQSDRGDKIKRRLRLGLQRLNPLPEAFYSAAGEDAGDDVCWATGGEIVAVFASDRRSAGCQRVVQHSVLSKGCEWDKSMMNQHRVTDKAAAGELVAGKFDKGGSVTIVMDLLVTDQVEGQLHQALRLVKLPHGAAGHDLARTCRATKRPFSIPSALGGAGNAACCHVCGYFFSSSLLTVAPHTRLPQFGHEVGRDLIMDTYAREAPASAFERIVCNLEQHLSKSAVWRSAVCIKKLLHAPLHTLTALMPPPLEAGGGAESGCKCDPCAHGCEGVAGLFEDEQDAAGLSGLALRKHQAEVARQDLFQRDIGALRARLEDALFAKVWRPEFEIECTCGRSRGIGRAQDHLRSPIVTGDGDGPSDVHVYARALSHTHGDRPIDTHTRGKGVLRGMQQLTLPVGLSPCAVAAKRLASSGAMRHRSALTAVTSTLPPLAVAAVAAVAVRVRGLLVGGGRRRPTACGCCRVGLGRGEGGASRAWCGGGCGERRWSSQLSVPAESTVRSSAAACTYAMHADCRWRWRADVASSPLAFSAPLPLLPPPSAPSLSEISHPPSLGICPLPSVSGGMFSLPQSLSVVFPPPLCVCRTCPSQIRRRCRVRFILRC